MPAPHRANELAADAFSVGTCHDAEALIGGLKSLSRSSLVNLTPHWLHVRVTHVATSARPVLSALPALFATGRPCRPRRAPQVFLHYSHPPMLARIEAIRAAPPGALVG